MGWLPKVLFALLLLLPGGLVVGPAILLVQRWRAQRSIGTHALAAAAAAAAAQNQHDCVPARELAPSQAAA